MSSASFDIIGYGDGGSADLLVDEKVTALCDFSSVFDDEIACRECL